jgi:hypothetical protein
VAPKGQKVILTLTCLEGDQCQVFFEPTGAEHTLKSDDRFTVEISGPGTGEPTLSYIPRGIVIWPWLGGAIARIRNATGDELPS